MLKITMEMEDDAVKESPLNTTASLTSLPKLTGPHCIGISKYDLEDVYRKNFQFPQGRLIPIQIYFPMEQGSHAIYPKIFEERAALGLFEPLNVDGYSQPADLSLLIGGQHPVVIINHASCVAMTDYAFLAEDLVSHGYNVSETYIFGKQQHRKSEQ
jgi:hypothetical protein